MAGDIAGREATFALDDSGLDEKLARLRSSIVQISAEMQTLQRAMQRGVGDIKAMADTLDLLSAAHAHLTDSSAKTAKSTTQLKGDLGGVAKASNSTARELMVVGQYADDVQSKTSTTEEGMEKFGDATSRTIKEAARLDRIGRGPRIADGKETDSPGDATRAERELGVFDDPMDKGELRRRTAGPMASLEERLAHLTQVEQRDGTLGEPDAGPATKAAAGDDRQLGKLQDISKTLEEIRKLHADMKPIAVKRRR